MTAVAGEYADIAGHTARMSIGGDSASKNEVQRHDGICAAAGAAVSWCLKEVALTQIHAVVEHVR